MSAGAGAQIVVDILVATYDGARHLDHFLGSVQAQTHGAWRLWIRDDGSTDATRDIIRRHAASDRRIVLLEDGPLRLGPGASFGWLLDHAPADARYLMFGDQDDVWLPEKIARTLAALREAEVAGPAPVLAHTDLTVVDDKLTVIHPSFWAYIGIDPEPVSLRRLVVQNVATGATMMINRPLRELVGRVPADAVYHDWWCACVAAAFGTIVVVREPTVLYRQHASNAVGAGRHRLLKWRELPGSIRRALAATGHLRSEVARTTRQAAALLERYEGRLPQRDRQFLRAYARMLDHGAVRRKVEVARLRLRREHGVWRNLGVLWRA